MPVRIFSEKKLVDPVNRLHIGIAACLAKNGCALHRLISGPVEFPEHLYPFQFAHDDCSFI